MTYPGSSTSLSGKGQRHEKIIADLEEIFLEKGFRKCTINELADRLKCSKRTLYEVAASKHELAIVVIERWLERIRHLGWAGALEHDDPAKRIEAYLKPGVSESRKASRVFVEDIQSFRPAALMLDAHQRERTKVLREILDDGVRRGRFRQLHSQLIAEIFLAAVGRINEPKVLEAADLTFSDAFAELFDLIMNGIVQDEPPPSKPKAR